MKIQCFRNLDLKAGDDLEVGLLTRFMERAKDEDWLMFKSAKAEEDIIGHFHDKRNYYRAQVYSFFLLKEGINIYLIPA